MLAFRSQSYRRSASFAKHLVNCRLKSTYIPTQELRHSDLKFYPTRNPKPLVPNDELVFGHVFTDHMLAISWTKDQGWNAPRILEYSRISMAPSASIFHYGMACFEGMKAYRDKEGRVRLFRPDKNMDRFHRSALRVALPGFNNEALQKCIMDYVKVEKRWIPQEKGYSLYLRPTMIATQEFVGVGPSNSALLFVIGCPVGPYYKTGFSAVTLWAESKYQRAWPGGTGDCKVAGNYAPTVVPQKLAAKQGCQQVLWLTGPEKNLTEVGVMNCFVFLEKDNGNRELVTPPLDGTILPGVTRDTVLALAREWGEFEVSERPINMNEILTAIQNGKLLEMFGAGTAAVLSPVKAIKLNSDETIVIPRDRDDPSQEAGPLTRRLYDVITDIQYGVVDHPYSVICDGPEPAKAEMPSSRKLN